MSPWPVVVGGGTGVGAELLPLHPAPMTAPTSAHANEIRRIDCLRLIARPRVLPGFTAHEAGANPASESEAVGAYRTSSNAHTKETPTPLRTYARLRAGRRSMWESTQRRADIATSTGAPATVDPACRAAAVEPRRGSDQRARSRCPELRGMPHRGCDLCHATQSPSREPLAPSALRVARAPPSIAADRDVAARRSGNAARRLRRRGLPVETARVWHEPRARPGKGIQSERPENAYATCPTVPHDAHPSVTQRRHFPAV
jgi:hypothetical protein